MNRHYIGFLLIIISAVGFGMMAVLAIYAYAGGINVTTLLFIRFSLSSLILFGYVVLKIGKISLTWKQLISLFVLGGVLYTLQSTCYFAAIRYIPVSLSVLLLYTYPVIVAVLSAIIDKERLPVKVILYILLSFIGLVFVFGTKYDEINYLGVLFGLSAPTIYSCYIILANRLVKTMSSITSSAFVTMFASISFLTVGLVNRELKFDFSLATWLPVAGIVIFSTVIAILTFFKGLEYIGSTRASVVSMLEPLVTIALSMILFDEKLQIIQFIGVVVVLGGCILTILSKRDKGSKQSEMSAVKEKTVISISED